MNETNLLNELRDASFEDALKAEQGFRVSPEALPDASFMDASVLAALPNELVGLDVMAIPAKYGAASVAAASKATGISLGTKIVSGLLVVGAALGTALGGANILFQEKQEKHNEPQAVEAIQSPATVVAAEDIEDTEPKLVTKPALSKPKSSKKVQKPKQIDKSEVKAPTVVEPVEEVANKKTLAEKPEEKAPPKAVNHLAAEVKLYGQAKKLENAGQNKEAITLYQQYVDAYPSGRMAGAASYAIVRLYREMNYDSKAMTAARKHISRYDFKKAEVKKMFGL